MSVFRTITYLPCKFQIFYQLLKEEYLNTIIDDALHTFAMFPWCSNCYSTCFNIVAYILVKLKDSSYQTSFPVYVLESCPYDLFSIN